MTQEERNERENGGEVSPLRMLVVDDNLNRIYASLVCFGERARNLLVDLPLGCGGEMEFSLPDKFKQVGGGYIEVAQDEGKVFADEIIERALREEKYGAILLDGDLGLELGDPSDGEYFARRLKEGIYGERNRETRIFSTSNSLGAIPSADDSYFLSHSPDGPKDSEISSARRFLAEIGRS